MATIAAIARRRAQVVQRISAAREDLAARFGIEAPEIVTTNRDFQVARVQELEGMADLLEAVLSIDAEPDSESTADESTADESTADESTADESTADGEDAGLLPSKLTKLLAENFENEDAIRAASDKELLAIKGIADASLEEIRRFYPKHSEQ